MQRPPSSLLIIPLGGEGRVLWKSVGSAFGLNPRTVGKSPQRRSSEVKLISFIKKGKNYIIIVMHRWVKISFVIRENLIFRLRLSFSSKCNRVRNVILLYLITDFSIRSLFQINTDDTRTQNAIKQNSLLPLSNLSTLVMVRLRLKH